MVTPNTNFLGINPFQDILEEEPRATFFSFQNQFGRSPTQQSFFRNRFKQLHDQFLGNLGQQIRGEEAPTAKFPNFMGGLDFGNIFAQALPFERGGPPRSIFAPSTRFLTF